MGRIGPFASTNRPEARESNMEQLIIQLVSGAVGGNVAGGLLKKFSLGTMGNSIAGIVGGGLGGQLLGGLMGSGAADAAAGMDIGSIIGGSKRTDRAPARCTHSSRCVAHRSMGAWFRRHSRAADRHIGRWSQDRIARARQNWPTCIVGDRGKRSVTDRRQDPMAERSRRRIPDRLCF